MTPATDPSQSPLWALTRDTFTALAGDLDEEAALGLLRGGFAGENGRFRVLVRVDVHQTVAVFALSPVELPAAARAEALAFIAAINQRQPIATLDIHGDDGSIRARAAVDLDGVDAAAHAEVLRPILDNIFWAAVTLLDLSLPGLLLIAQGQSATDALTRLELPDVVAEQAASKT
jgi:hypothetical protein